MRVAIVCLVAACSVLPAQDPLPGSGWRFVNLDMVVTILAEERRLEVVGKARLRLVSLPETKQLALAINARKALLKFERAKSSRPGKTELNARLESRASIRLVRVHFDDPVAKGGEVEIEFAYSGGGMSSQFVLSKRCAFASWVEAWYPFPIPTSPRGSRAALGRASGTIRFRGPRDWHVCSNGELLDRRIDGETAVERWHSEAAVARSFAAGPYEVAREKVGDRVFGIYLLSPKPTSAKGQVEVLANSIRALEKRLGTYPYPSFGIAEVPGPLGRFYASSEQGFIMVKPGVFAIEGGNVPLFAHEAAHGWWGNLVGTRGPGAKLCSESLAQYCAVYAIEALEGERAAAEFLRFSRKAYPSRQCAQGYFGLLRRGHDKPLAKLANGRWDHTLSDAKGHWVYHMLRRRVGDERFFATLRRLIKDHADGGMSLADLRKTFVAAAPEAELETFFAQWLDRTGAPVIEAEWTADGKDGVDLVLRQEQKGPAFHLQLEVDVLAGEKKARHTVDVRKKEVSVRLAAPGTVTGVELDPEHRLLTWRKEYGAKPAR